MDLLRYIVCYVALLALAVGANAQPRKVAPEVMQVRATTPLLTSPGARNDPDAQHLPPGTSVELLRVDGEWHEVRGKDRTGWVPSRVLEPPGSCHSNGSQQLHFLARHHGFIAVDDRFADAGLPIAATRSVTAGHRSHTAVSLRMGLERYPVGTAALLYYSGANATCVLLVTRTGIAAYAVIETHTSADLEREVYALLTRLVPEACLYTRSPKRAGDGAQPRSGDQCAHSDGDAAADQAASDVLSRLLLPESVEVELASIRNLIIVPHGSLAIVPFGALRLPKAKVELVERFAITLAPAFTQIGIGKGLHVPRSHSAGRPVSIVVGNPAYKDDVWMFDSLPGAEEEAVAVAKTLKVQPLLREAATLDGLRSRLVAVGERPLDVLYLASHGIATGDDPNTAGSGKAPEGFVAMAGGERLSASTLPSIGYRGSRLVVLSACVTGRGWIVESGSVGLPRLFHQHGAEEVVMSLWQVDDAATNALMTAFVSEYIAAWPNASAARALQTASLRVRKQYPRPAFWAAFNVFGVGPF